MEWSSWTPKRIRQILPVWIRCGLDRCLTLRRMPWPLPVVVTTESLVARLDAARKSSEIIATAAFGKSRSPLWVLPGHVRILALTEAVEINEGHVMA